MILSQPLIQQPPSPTTRPSAVSLSSSSDCMAAASAALKFCCTKETTAVNQTQGPAAEWGGRWSRRCPLCRSVSQAKVMNTIATPKHSLEPSEQGENNWPNDVCVPEQIEKPGGQIKPHRNTANPSPTAAPPPAKSNER